MYPDYYVGGYYDGKKKADVEADQISGAVGHCVSLCESRTITRQC